MVIVIGPIMYLVPNARDKRLTALRATARAEGLTVQITSVPKLDPSAAERVSAGGKTLVPKISCAAYKLPIGQKLVLKGEITLLKMPEHPSLLVEEVLPGIALSEGSDRLFWQQYNQDDLAAQRLLEAFAQLPPDTLAVAIEDHHVICFWLEKAPADAGQVELIREVLEGIRGDLKARFGILPG